MKIADAGIYRCPISLSKLSLAVNKQEKDDVMDGTLTSETGIGYKIVEGVPDFTYPKELAQVDKQTRELYDKLANEYDKFADFPFRTFGISEAQVRENITDRLNIRKDSKVLEIGGGDGRGAEHIVKRLGAGGHLWFQELARAFLNNAQKRLKSYGDIVSFSSANASYLSFPDNYFDAAHHFGGINTFSEVERCMKELARVVKPGGKVVVGDEGIGPWLRKTEFGKVMINSNPLIGYEVPISSIPVEARDVKVEWIMQGAFFLIEFTVGEGAPVANYHIPIPSERGGTHWSRYYGNLEGISDEAKKMAQEARAARGISMHDWLDQVVREAAKRDLRS
jgi:ubiquinone/menaquinone biosynthesis C-methylase UbiE